MVPFYENEYFGGGVMKLRRVSGIWESMPGDGRRERGFIPFAKTTDGHNVNAISLHQSERVRFQSCMRTTLKRWRCGISSAIQRDLRPLFRKVFLSLRLMKQHITASTQITRFFGFQVFFFLLFFLGDDDVTHLFKLFAVIPIYMPYYHRTRNVCQIWSRANTGIKWRSH